MTKQVFTLDTNSGKTGWVPAVYLEIPQFKEHLVEVEEGTKDRNPALHKPTDAEGHVEKGGTQKKLNDKKDEAPTQPALPTLGSELS